MLRLSRLILCPLALVLFTAGANANPVTWYLQGVVFDDGGKASGYFTFDAEAGTPCSLGLGLFVPCGVYSNVHITTTSGTARTGATYTSVCGQDVPSCTGLAPNSTQVLNLTTTDSDQTGEPGFAIYFTAAGLVPPAGLNDLGGAFDLSNFVNTGVGEESTCIDAACSTNVPPQRITVAGTVSAYAYNDASGITPSAMFLWFFYSN